MEGGFVGHTFERDPHSIHARFGLIWFSGFRGEDLNVKVYDVLFIFGNNEAGYKMQLKGQFALLPGCCRMP
jgi:hypothetical protein